MIVRTLGVDQPYVPTTLADVDAWAAWVRCPVGTLRRPLHSILVWDNLAGHRNYPLVRWLYNHGIWPIYTPIGGSWLNMAESIQRIIVRRALAGHHPTTPDEIIAWLQATVAGWNIQPTPFVWGGARRERRQRARQRRLGGSGATIRTIG
jgi:hypothetical protein